MCLDECGISKLICQPAFGIYLVSWHQFVTFLSSTLTFVAVYEGLIHSSSDKE